MFMFKGPYLHGQHVNQYHLENHGVLIIIENTIALGKFANVTRLNKTPSSDANDYSQQNWKENV